MFLIGLTGGIAAGKSTVAARWVEHGAIEIDTDKLAREVVEPGTTGSQLIRQEFGPEVFDDSGRLDRKKLAGIVFHDHSKRNTLEQIIHPLVKQQATKLINSYPGDSIVIYNVPLLVEAEVSLPFDRIVTVEAPVSTQIDRLIHHRGMTQSEAVARVNSQASSAQRANHADHILSSNQDLALLLKDADKLWAEFNRLAAIKAHKDASASESNLPGEA
jgi:dephospho-CoA kinase